MLKLTPKLANIGLLALGLSLLGSPSALGLPDSNQQDSRFHNGVLDSSRSGYLRSPQTQTSSINQVTSVSELRDVEPTEWAYEALRSLVERYGCIVGYPDRTFRGNRALTRWEFAAGLNACMNVMERLIQENVAVLQEDIDKLKRLAEEFQAELAALGARVDNLESRVSFLEDHQFSTTTTLSGEVVLAVSGVASGDRFRGTERIPQITTLGHRTRLELNTSFTGEDLLYTRLATGAMPDFTEEAGTFQAATAFAQPDDSDLAVEVLFYNFPIGDNVQAVVGPAGIAFDDFTNTLNVLDGDGASGAISAFGTRNPIYYQGEGAGGGLQGNFGSFEISAGYLASDGADPSEGNGLFNGAYGAIAQIGYVPDETFGIAFVYAHGYNTLGTGTGTVRSNFTDFGQLVGQEITGDEVDDIGTSHNSYGLTFSWQVADNFVFGGWGGFTTAQTLNSLDLVDAAGDPFTVSRGDLDIWQWAVTFAFPDVFKEGSMAGIVFGMQPWVSNSTPLLNGNLVNEGDTSYHIEAFYEYAVNDNISITPGVMVVTSPDFSDANSTLVIGTIRTTFTF